MTGDILSFAAVRGKHTRRARKRLKLARRLAKKGRSNKRRVN